MKIVKITLLIGMLSLLFSVLSVSAETAASAPDPEKAAVVATTEKRTQGKQHLLKMRLSAAPR